MERKTGVLRIVGDLGIGQPPQRTVFVAHDRPKVLEARAAERRILREQEIAAPETLSCDRPVGLSIDGEEDARLAIHLRHTMHEHQHVAVRTTAHGALAHPSSRYPALQ